MALMDMLLVPVGRIRIATIRPGPFDTVHGYAMSRRPAPSPRYAGQTVDKNALTNKSQMVNGSFQRVRGAEQYGMQGLCWLSSPKPCPFYPVEWSTAWPVRKKPCMWKNPVKRYSPTPIVFVACNRSRIWEKTLFPIPEHLRGSDWVTAIGSQFGPCCKTLWPRMGTKCFQTGGSRARNISMVTL